MQDVAFGEGDCAVEGGGCAELGDAFLCRIRIVSEKSEENEIEM